MSRDIFPQGQLEINECLLFYSFRRKRKNNDM